MQIDERLTAVQAGLQSLGYPADLVRSNYRFSNLLAATDGGGFNTIDLAAFAINPPSYSSACLGVVVAPQAGVTAEYIQSYKLLGAPRLLVLEEDETHVWSLTAEGLPTPVEVIKHGRMVSHLSETIARRTDWAPSAVLRGKSARAAGSVGQLDFYGVGLLLAIESEVQSRLDDLLTRAVSNGEQAYRDRFMEQPGSVFYTGLFRLIFRFVAAKMLGDRGVRPDVNWTSPDAVDVISEVDRFYFSGDELDLWSSDVPDEPTVRNAAWDTIRYGLRFDNLSVEALAYVYENTFVTKDTRTAYGTHATPREVAEFMLRHLPIETLPQEERTIFEPFAGAAPFLVAGLARLRSLLPPDWTDAQRHSYFVRMLRGVELDAFAREVARYSLILADYPNPNGWCVAQADVFGSGTADFERLRADANIVLCNPPYEKFTRSERDAYGTKNGVNKAVRALNLVLQKPPKMLGFVLPRVAVSGVSYQAAHSLLNRTYSNVDLLELPDGVFKKSHAETVLLLAHGDTNRAALIQRRGHVTRAKYPSALEDDTVEWRVEDVSTLDLYGVLKKLSERSRLAQAAEVFRGVDYLSHVAEKDRFSDVQREGFAPGLEQAKRQMRSYSVPKYRYINMAPSVIESRAYQHNWSDCKVIANYGRLSIGEWVLGAMVDNEGIACTKRFYGAWPRDESVSLEVLAGILNGPVANAWIKHHSTGRDNQLRHIRTVPMPVLSEAASELIAYYVAGYLNATARIDDANDGLGEAFSPEARVRVEEKRTNLLLQIDAGILAGYNLNPDIEHQLLARFEEQRRPGTNLVGYPEDQWEAAKATWKTELHEAEQNRRRHELIDRKYLDGLSREEQVELDALTVEVDSQDSDFYEPILSAIKQDEH